MPAPLARGTFCHAFQTGDCKLDANTCQYEHRQGSREEILQLLSRRVAKSKGKGKSSKESKSGGGSNSRSGSEGRRSGNGSASGSRSPSVDRKLCLCRYVAEGKECPFMKNGACQFSHDVATALPYVPSKGRGKGRGKSRNNKNKDSPAAAAASID